MGVKMRILVVDDDLDSCDILSLTLGKESYEVTCARTYEEGLRTLNRIKPDLIILDVMLPRMNGWDLCQQIRTFSDVPILLISAFARTADDMAHGMDCGADGYLAKPINSNLLKATIRALLRRNVQADGYLEHVAYVDAHLTVDLHNRHVYVQGNLVRLSLLEYQLLELLVRNINQTVPTLEIVEELWPTLDIEKAIGYVRTYVKRLREAIEPDPSHPQYLITERGFGYSFLSSYMERT